MYKNKSPFSHNQPTGGQPRSPLATGESPGNYLFSQVLSTTNTPMNKVKFTQNIPSNMNSNLNNGPNINNIKRKPNQNQLNIDDDLGCDEVLIKPKPEINTKDDDFICNEQLTPMGRPPSKQTQFQLQSPTELLVRRPNTHNTHSPSLPSLMDLKCNEELVAEKQNSYKSGQLSQVLKRTSNLLETYKKMCLEMSDKIVRLQAENQRLLVKNHGR